MLPYNRKISQHLYQDQKADYDMLWKPYTQAKQLESLSPTDSVLKYTTDSRDTNRYYRYSAFTDINDPNYFKYYTNSVLDWCSAQITARLKGVHPEGKNIVVPDATIASVMDSYMHNANLNPGILEEQVVMYIVNYIKNEYQTINQNNKLSAWVQKYDMDSGLKQFNDVKLNENQRTMFYNWNY